MPAPVRPLPLFSILLSLTVPAACAEGGGGEAGWSVTDSAGVTLVEQTLDPARALALDEVWRVGSLDGDEATQFFTPRDAVLGDDGRVYVLDSGNHRVKVFDVTDGSYLYGFGSEGQGPGEFEGQPGRLVAGGGQLVVSDLGRRFHAFRPDGTLVGTVAAGPLLPAGHIATSAAYDGSRFLLQATRFYDLEAGASVPGQPTALLALDFENSAIGDSTGLRWDGLPPREDDPTLGGPVQPMVEQRWTWWFDGRGRMHRVFSEDYAWEVYAPDGPLLRRVTNHVDRVPVDPTLRDRYAANQEERCAASGNPECDAILGRQLPAVLAQPLPEFMPTIYQLDGSDDGALLVLRSDRGWDVVDGFSSKTYDFFAPDGRFRGRFTKDPGFRVIAVDDEYIVAIERDELDVESLVLYRWSEPDSA